jgi:hypothetical protein
MFTRRRVRRARVGFEICDPETDAAVGRLSGIRDGWLIITTPDGAPDRPGYLPTGAVQFVDPRGERIVLRPAIDTGHLLEPRVHLEARAARVVDAVAAFGLFGFASTNEGTFLNPR